MADTLKLGNEIRKGFVNTTNLPLITHVLKFYEKISRYAFSIISGIKMAQVVESFSRGSQEPDYLT